MGTTRLEYATVPCARVQLRHALECYNVTIEEGEEDHMNINIRESVGQHEVIGLKAKALENQEGEYWFKSAIEVRKHR